MTSQQDSGARQTPRIVMIVNNDIATDTRVRKEAMSVAQLGLDVIVLGTTNDERPSGSAFGAVTVLRVPAPKRLHAARLRRRRAVRRWRPPLVGYARTEDRAAAVLRLAVRGRETEARRGRTAAEYSGTASGASARRTAMVRLGNVRASAAIRGRLLSQRVVNRGLRDAWRAWDATWARIPVAARWRHVVPEAADYELAFGPVLDQLQPDVIHAHDMHMLGVADLAAARAALAGRRVPWIYDSHEYVPGLSRYGGRTPRVVAAWADLEREYISSAARVITVSEPIADALVAHYALPRRPDVVLNIPSAAAAARRTVPTVRAVCGLPDDVVLLVYSGGVHHGRGVQTPIGALRQLPGVHLAINCVPNPHTPPVELLRTLADELGVADRVHFLEPVDPGNVVGFLSGGTIGLLPFLHFPSHDLTLTNKLFEYLHAGLPVVVSDVPAHKDFVTRHGTGTVHEAGNEASLAAAVQTVLADRPRYAAAVADPTLRATYSWARQAEVLRRLYEDVLDRPLERSTDPGLAIDEGTPERPLPAIGGQDPVAALVPSLAAAAEGTAAQVGDGEEPAGPLDS